MSNVQGIFYLWRTTLKNSIKDLKKHPGRLVAYILILVLMGICLGSAFMIDDHNMFNEVRPISEIGAIIFALFMFLFISNIIQGLSSGVTFFKMADVNFLFVSPISSRKILAYGLVKQMGTVLFLSLFIFFQASWLKTTYGINPVDILIIFVGYFALVFIASITSMAVYSITCGNEKRKRIVKILIWLMLLPSLIALGKSYYAGDTGIKLIVNAMNSGINDWIPFVGWIKALTFGMISGHSINLLSFLLATAVGLVVVITIIMKSNNNYYEDALGLTETLYHRQEDAKKGKVAEVSLNKKIKVKEPGIKRGAGAKVFFFKHLLEARRSSKFIMDTYTLMQVGLAIVFAFTTRDSNSILPVFAIVTYLQFFTSFSGRWARELTMPYIYMMPEKPFKKLIYAVLEGLVKCTTDGILVFVLAGLIVGASPIDILTCIIVRVTFGLLFISGNVLAQRLLGNVQGKMLISFLTFLVMIFLALPGIVGTIFIGVTLNLGTGALLAAAIWNLGISMIILFLCRNILNSIEQNM